MKLLKLLLIFYAMFCFLAGVYLILKGGFSIFLAIYFFVNAVVIILGTLFEKKYEAKITGKNLKPTGEKFLDHKDGRVVEVHMDSETGERSYIHKKG